jgi:tetratricopeptide (TPR) repeat protein
VTTKPAAVEVTQVQSDFVLKPAQELTRAPAPPLPEVPAPERAATTNETTNGAKRGFLSRLNPFSGKPKTTPAATAADTVAPRGTDASPPSLPVTAVPRYTYLSPAAPTAGNRAESEKAFKRGLKAQKGGSRAEAVSEYQAAVKADPANYDAYYNLGLAALGSGDTRLSLWAYEIALALKPDADDARYNFALALKAGGYWIDASDQLQKLLAANASDVRAHLSLGNLYSQQLEQPVRAREHYLRVLELNPRHAEAAKIRYWLTANP